MPFRPSPARAARGSHRREAAQAQRQRWELEILYELSFGLFTVSPRPGALAEATGRTLRAIGAEAGTLWLAGEDSPACVLGAPLDPGPGVRAQILGSGAGIQETLPAKDGARTASIPLAVGERVSGVLAARGALASGTVLESAGRLLALAIERDRLLEEAAHLEAVRESDALKTGLIRAVSHDLRTPLTAMRLEIESLDHQFQDQPAPLASVRGLSLAQERLERRIDHLLSLARLEAGVARPRPEPVPPGELFRAARESLALILAGREVQVRVTAGCPDLWADPSLTLEALVNLLENAARAAPPGSPIELVALPETPADPAGPAWVRVEVRDAEVVARRRWGWRPGWILPLAGFFLAIDLAFFGANIVKIQDGGWFPLAAGLILYLLMATWKQGRQILGDRLTQDALPFERFAGNVQPGSPMRVPGTAVFMSRDPVATPTALLHNLKHNKVLHERVILLTVQTEEIPAVAPADRVAVEALGHDFYRVTARYGFTESPAVPDILGHLKEKGFPLDLMSTTFFLSRETLIPSPKRGMALWREVLFAVMMRNALRPTDFFRIPPNRVVELGRQVRL